MSNRRREKFLFLGCFFLAGQIAYSADSVTDSGVLQEHPEVPDASKEVVVEVKAKKSQIQKAASTSSTLIDRKQISQLAQGGEASLPRLLTTTTPGAVQGAFGQVFFRGNHGNVQYQIDGVQFPDSPSNTFGQTISPRNIDHMEVITGGIPAEFGQRLAAVVNIVTKTGPEENEGEIELNYGSYNSTTPHLLYGGSNASGSLHYFLSLNYNRTDRGLDTPQPVSDSDRTQGGTDSVHNVATGNSEFFRLDWLADNQNKLSVTLFNSYSNFQIPNYPSSFNQNSSIFQPGFQDEFGNSTYNYMPSNTDDQQTEMNAYLQVVWKHTFDNASYLQVAPYYKFSSIKFKNDPNNDLAASTLGIAGANPVSFAQDRHTNNIGLKSDYSFRPHSQHWVKTGFQTQVARSDGWISIQKNISTAPVGDGSPSVGYFEGVYIQDEFTIFKPLVLTAGVRFDATQFSFSDQNSSDSMFQPRIGLSYMATETTKLHLFYGKLFQPAPVENLRFQYSITSGSSTPLQPYDIKAEKDDFYEFGVAQQIWGDQVVAANVYYKDGVNVLDDTQLLNTSIAQPYNYAQGYAYGAELSVKGHVAEDWSEFVNYSYSIARGKGISGGIFAFPSGSTPPTDYVLLDHVQIHTLNAGLTFSKNYFWSTLQGLYGSGLRTGPNNSTGLPGHFTMDATVGYEFHGKSWFSQFKLSGDVLNIFNNVYPITVANGYNGSHYAVGRQFFIRLTKSF